MEDEPVSHHYVEEEDENDGVASDAIHGRFQSPLATCLDCRQLVKKEDLGYHRLKKCLENCGKGCEAHLCKARFKGHCKFCSGYVYPYLQGMEILFSHSCNERVHDRGCKFICAACSTSFNSRKHFKHHADKDSCDNKCSYCNCPMFTKQSVFGIKVDHVCHTL